MTSGGSFACGSLYMDDEETFNYYKKGDYSIRKFVFNNGELASTNESGKNDILFDQQIERIVIIGVSSSSKLPKKALLSKKSGDATPIVLEIVPMSSEKSPSVVYHIRKPGIQVNEDWKISLLFDV